MPQILTDILGMNKSGLPSAAVRKKLLRKDLGARLGGLAG